jgi:uncharacterized protein YbjT (DUF2867 family)
MSDKPLRIAVAGAQGFIGRALIERLRGDASFAVTALARSPRADLGVPARACDLLRAEDAERALSDIDVAVYLVHAMMPNDRLVQASFRDLDLLAADNFGRAAARCGVRQIVYLGGLAPADDSTPSEHLASRIEVERALGSHKVPVTTLRAGLVFGPGGSSSRIVFNLARRLPVMVCPAWTATPTQPIALDDVVTLLAGVLGRPETFGEAWDVAGPDTLTYRELMALAAREARGHAPRMLSVPVLTPQLSALWVSLVTGAPRALVKPLVGSLSHPMLVRDRRLQQRLGVPGKPIGAALSEAIRADVDAGTPRAFEAAARPPGPSRVRSIQRLSAPAGGRARDVAERYFDWLGEAFAPVIEVRRVRGDVALAFRGLGPALLVLSPELLSSDRAVYRVAGGLLSARLELPRVEAGAPQAGTFEFREVLGGEAVLVAIADFVPRLPWWLYVSTQAQAHRLVMALFGHHLGAADRASAAIQAPATA